MENKEEKTKLEILEEARKAILDFRIGDLKDSKVIEKIHEIEMSINDIRKMVRPQYLSQSS